VLNDLTGPAIHAVADEIRAAGGRAEVIEGDVSEWSTGEKMLAAATGTFGFGTRFVDVNRASAKLATIESGDCLVTFFGVGHFNETEATRTPGFAIGENADAIHLAMGFEELAQLILARVEAQVPNENVFHACLDFCVCEPGRTVQKTEAVLAQTRKRAESIANSQDWQAESWVD